MSRRTERVMGLQITREEWEAVKAALRAGTNDAGRAVLARYVPGETPTTTTQPKEEVKP